MTDQELDNQEIDTVDNSEVDLDSMFQEDEPDYKELYEKEKSRVEKISQDYKTVQADANRYKDSTAKVINSIKTHGVGDLDADGNLIIYAGQRQQEEKPKEVLIDEQIRSIKSKYEAGDIDITEYTDAITDLKAEKKAEALKRELMQERTQEETQKAITSEKALIESQLNMQFPDHSNTDSELFKEMAKILRDNPLEFGDVNDVKNKDSIKSRLSLARQAHESLVRQGKAKQIARNTVVNNNFQTINSGDFDATEKQDNFSIANDIGTRYAVENLGLNKKDVGQINKMVSNWNRDGSMTIEI